MREKLTSEQLAEQRALTKKLARGFLCSVRERYDLLRMGLGDDILIHINVEGDPLTAAILALDSLSRYGDHIIESQVKQEIGKLESEKI